jgi:hypothetical protein
MSLAPRRLLRYANRLFDAADSSYRQRRCPLPDTALFMARHGNMPLHAVCRAGAAAAPLRRDTPSPTRRPPFHAAIDGYRLLLSPPPGKYTLYAAAELFCRRADAACCRAPMADAPQHGARGSAMPRRRAPFFAAPTPLNAYAVDTPFHAEIVYADPDRWYAVYNQRRAATDAASRGQRTRAPARAVASRRSSLLFFIATPFHVFAVLPYTLHATPITIRRFATPSTRRPR